MIKQGFVKWFNDSKGYGFIECEGKDLYVHYSNIDTEGFKTLSEGWTVEFEVHDGHRKGTFEAKKVKRV